MGPEGLNREVLRLRDQGVVLVEHRRSAKVTYAERPRSVYLFFSIYYLMTGMSAVHVLVGLLILIGLLYRTLRHDPATERQDIAGYVCRTYWYFTSIVWIVTVPMFYFIS